MKSFDPFTPFFPQWQRQLHRLRHRLHDPSVRVPVLYQLQLLFADWIRDPWLDPTPHGPGSRQRRWPIRLTFWTFLAQVFASGSSCRDAVRHAQAQAHLQGQPAPKDDTGAYCEARRRLPLKRLLEAIKEIASRLEVSSSRDDFWKNHRVCLLDGTTLTADDTEANRRAFAQPSSQAPGCGFPLLRLVALFSLATGALLGFVTGTYLQSELTLAKSLLEQMAPGDVLLADRLFGAYRVLVMARARGVHVVARLHATRKADLRQGRALGRLDRLVSWRRAREVGAGFTPEQWCALPETLEVRLVRFTVQVRGFRSRTVTLVTTLLDPKQYPVSALAALYRRRWQIELNFRQIKTALGMEHLAVRTPAMIHRSVAMHLLAYQLTRALMLQAALVWSQALDRISFQGSLDAIHHYADALRQARNRRARQTLIAQLLHTLAFDAVPERPDRHEPRALKRRLKAYPRLNKPRRLFREISAHERRRRAVTRPAKRPTS
jgi:hypothetical protein